MFNTVILTWSSVVFLVPTEQLYLPLFTLSAARQEIIATVPHVVTNKLLALYKHCGQ